MKTRPFLKPAIKNYFIFVLLIWITACSNQTMKITTEFEKIFDAKFSEGEPGGVILVKKGEEVIFLKSYGIADLETKEVITPHTIFNTGSVSKTMVSNGILMLHEQGELSLEDPISNIFIDFTKRKTLKGISRES